MASKIQVVANVPHAIPLVYPHIDRPSLQPLVDDTESSLHVGARAQIALCVRYELAQQ